MGGNGLSDRKFIEKYDSYKKNYGCFFRCFSIFIIIVGLVFIGCVIIISLFGTLDWNKIVLEIFARIAGIVVGVSFVKFGITEWIDLKKQKEKELGMSEKEASRRYLSIIQKPIYGELYPIVQKMCRLNPDAQSGQEEQINGWFTSEGYDEHFGVMYDKKFDFNMTYRDADFDLAIQILNKEPMAYRQWFVEKLFKLAIVDDGIHNDEWNLLMDIMKQLKFNKNYVDFFLKRYG
ncbi:MAG: hypothetical protein UH071_07430, partial [Paludibacteraceae bacterium]|nr:hypothetical protein [Paludibacteraceae bacterium]